MLVINFKLKSGREQSGAMLFQLPPSTVERETMLVFEDNEYDGPSWQMFEWSREAETFAQEEEIGLATIGAY